MHAQIVSIDEPTRTVVIDAHAGPLKSHLTCQVKPHDDGCLLLRTQSYPGFVGKLFTKLKAEREAQETVDYLKAWEAFAQRN